jgi:hypothetical protein
MHFYDHLRPHLPRNLANLYQLGRVRFKLNFLKTQRALRIFTQNLYMKGLRLILLGLVMFIACHVNGQAKLGIQLSNLVVSQDSAKSISFNIVNYGNSQFQGVVSLLYTVNGGAVTQSNISDTSLFQFESGILTISPNGGSAQETVQVYTTPQNINIGTSVVVIWPISQSALTYDSTTTSVQVTPVLTSGLKSFADIKTDVFINQQQLFIQTTAENYLKHLRVYNLQGQLLIDQNLASSSALNMDKYSTGCYLVELTFIDNSQKVYKVVNNGVK